MRRDVHDYCEAGCGRLLFSVERQIGICGECRVMLLLAEAPSDHLEIKWVSPFVPRWFWAWKAE